MTDASFSIEFKIPASLARSIREDNARRLAEMQMMENNNKNNTHSNDEDGCEKDEEDWEDHVDLGYKRPGQDVRYSVDDSKIRALGWEPVKVFDTEISKIVEHYKNNFRW